MSETKKTVTFHAPKYFLKKFDEWYPKHYNNRTDAILTAMRRLKDSDNVSITRRTTQ